MKGIVYNIANDRGSALVLALLVLVLLTLMGISATTTSTIEVQMAGNDKVHEMAFYAAESGWQEALNWLDRQYPGITDNRRWDAGDETFSPKEGDDTPPDYISLEEDNITAYRVEIDFAGTTPVSGYGTDFRRFNYRVDSEGVGPGNARSKVRVTAGKVFDTGGY